jgi:hypothetical protein
LEGWNAEKFDTWRPAVLELGPNHCSNCRAERVQVTGIYELT